MFYNNYGPRSNHTVTICSYVGKRSRERFCEELKHFFYCCQLIFIMMTFLFYNIDTYSIKDRLTLILRKILPSQWLIVFVPLLFIAA